ncbi:hypothetical protein Dimus_036340, partial [Dionaea muscipula]
MKRTTAEDGEFRVQVACRRSSRLSSSLPSIYPDLVALEVEPSSIAVVGESSEEEDDDGMLPEMVVTASSEEGDGLRGEEEGTMVSSFLPDLSPISEEERKGGSSSSSFSGSTTPSPEAAVRLCQSAIGAGGHASVSSPFPSSLVAVARGGEGTHGLGSAMVADDSALIDEERGEFRGSAECERLPAVDDGALLAEDRDEVRGSDDGRLAENLGENLGLTSGVGSAAMVIDGPVRLSSSFDHVQVDIAVPGNGGSAVVAGSVGQQPSLVSCCSLALVGRDAKLIGGGLVSEEEAVSPEAGAALRPQPTDGLRQPPLSPVEPALMAG